MSSVDKQIEALNMARSANIAYQHFEFFLDNRKQSLLTQLIQLYRSGEPDPYAYKAVVAALCSLDDLVDEIKTAISRSDRLKEGTFNAN